MSLGLIAKLKKKFKVQEQLRFFFLNMHVYVFQTYQHHYVPLGSKLTPGPVIKVKGAAPKKCETPP